MSQAENTDGRTQTTDLNDIVTDPRVIEEFFKRDQEADDEREQGDE